MQTLAQRPSSCAEGRLSNPVLSTRWGHTLARRSLLVLGLVAASWALAGTASAAEDQDGTASDWSLSDYVICALR